MTAQTLDRARAGDEDAFRELTDPYRRELQLHVYRIVGSAQDAEDLLQETLLAAWRGLEQFEERASVRAWLYRIATNRSLDALRASRRRAVRRSGRDGRHRRRRGPAHRRRLADDAALAMGVPGPHRDRRVPPVPRGLAGGVAAARADACERPARLRVLPADANGHRASVLVGRPHAGRRQGIRDDLVYRHQCL